MEAAAAKIHTLILFGIGHRRDLAAAVMSEAKSGGATCQGLASVRAPMQTYHVMI